MEAFSRKYGDGEYLAPEDVYIFLQSKKLGLSLCPLGFVEVTFDHLGQTLDGFFDSWSQINVMTKDRDFSLGLRVQVNMKMKLTGISKNEVALAGIFEDVPILIYACVWGKPQFWASNWDVPLILGRPFWVNFEANLNYSEKYGETLSLRDLQEIGLRIPTCDPYCDEWMSTWPGKAWEKVGGWSLKVNTGRLCGESKMKEDW